jgi:hypothetical protein
VKKALANTEPSAHAHSVSYRGAVTCPELGANRKWPTQNQSDAIAPNSEVSLRVAVTPDIEASTWN